MKALLHTKTVALYSLSLFSLILLLLPQCKKLDHNILPPPPTPDTFIANYNVVKTGFFYGPPNITPWDTVYGPRSVQIIISDSIGTFISTEDSLTFYGMYSSQMSSHYHGNYYDGDPSFKYIITYNHGDSIRVFYGFIHTSGGNGCYWTGTRIQ